jgi:hypothetical protein
MSSMARGGTTGAMAPLDFCNSFSQFNDNSFSHCNTIFQIMGIEIYVHIKVLVPFLYILLIYIVSLIWIVNS